MFETNYGANTQQGRRTKYKLQTGHISGTVNTFAGMSPICSFPPLFPSLFNTPHQMSSTYRDASGKRDLTL